MKRYFVFFVIGGVCYPVLEVVWRGYTHWSMALAGGVCFALFSRISRAFAAKPLLLKSGLCALAVTSVELVFGVVFNILLGMNVWDYSNRLFHLWGQICPLFTLIWWFLSILLLPVVDRLNRLLDKGLFGAAWL